MQFQKELDLARSVAMHAGDLALGYQTRDLKPESKPDLSPVTIADKECERLIATRIAEFFPDDGLLGEEGARKESRNGRVWIIDPIDGTRDFVRGLPLWAQLIGLEVDGEPVLGVAGFPARRETYHAVKGHGAYLNEKPISISAIDLPQNAVTCIGGLRDAAGCEFAPRLLEWLQQFWSVRCLGGAVDAMMLASGQAEIWVEPVVKPWDLAAVKVILEEAGAKFMNFDGGSSIYGGNAVAFVPPLESAVRELLKT